MTSQKFHLSNIVRTGVKFMYECVMAMKGHDGKGCILADEMYATISLALGNPSNLSV